MTARRSSKTFAIIEALDDEVEPERALLPLGGPSMLDGCWV
jgi:hypothetical protein